MKRGLRALRPETRALYSVDGDCARCICGARIMLHDMALRQHAASQGHHRRLRERRTDEEARATR